MSVFDVFYYAGALIITLGVLITFHEFGHYWVARHFGVKVLRFSVGFGKSLWTRRAGPDQTEYTVAAIPLGGYVKMLDEREGEVAEAERDRAFNNQSLGVRTAIVAAGPIFNFVLAILLYWVMFMIGVQGLKPIVGDIDPQSAAEQAGLLEGDQITAVGDAPVSTWKGVVLALLNQSMDKARIELRVTTTDGADIVRIMDAPSLEQEGNILENTGIHPGSPKLDAVIDEVVAAGAAEAAGLQVGDRILSSDDTRIESWTQWVTLVRASPQQAMQIAIERDGEQLQLTITPGIKESDEGEQRGFIGARVRVPEGFEETWASWRATQQFGPVEAFGQALGKSWEMTSLTLRLLGKMLTGQATVKNLSGPLSIAQYAGQSASIGLAQFLGFLALVSLSLGILNLMPVPVLDGGHLLFYLIEFVRGKPLSEDAMVWGQKVGIFLLLGLMTIAFYNDLNRLFGP
jgi:regulator of sigma E protease